jgi:hypothetical protein
MASMTAITVRRIMGCPFLGEVGPGLAGGGGKGRDRALCARADENLPSDLEGCLGEIVAISSFLR